MSFSALYQQVILDHNLNPRHFHVLESASHQLSRLNPVCGDQITLYLIKDSSSIQNIAFQGEGCAICLASASIMTTVLHQKSLEDAHLLIDQVLEHFSHKKPFLHPLIPAALFEVVTHPARIPCAALAWQIAQTLLCDSDH